jgi:hypothetical protein
MNTDGGTGGGRGGGGGAYDSDADDSTCMDGGQCYNNTTLIFNLQIFPENIK